MKDQDDLLARITINPAICHGKPIIRGLRYPVETMLELMASGMSHQEILDDYEDLEQADLWACLLLVVKLMENQHDIGKIVQPSFS